jgi:hypothetical protein
MGVLVSTRLEHKKPYQQPNLRVYGDIYLVTQSINMGKVKDAQAANKSA